MAARRGHILLIASWRHEAMGYHGISWDTVPGDVSVASSTLDIYGVIWTYIICLCMHVFCLFRTQMSFH